MKSVMREAGIQQSELLLNLSGNKLVVSTVAIMTALAATTPAWSTIDNEVKVTGSSPGNTDDVTDTATEEVDVEDAAPTVPGIHWALAMRSPLPVHTPLHRVTLTTCNNQRIAT